MTNLVLSNAILGLMLVMVGMWYVYVPKWTHIIAAIIAFPSVVAAFVYLALSGHQFIAGSALWEWVAYPVMIIALFLGTLIGLIIFSPLMMWLDNHGYNRFHSKGAAD